MSRRVAIRWVVAAAALVGVAMAVSCGRGEGVGSSETAPVSVSAEREAVSATATLETGRITTAERARVRVEAWALRDDVASVDVDVEAGEPWADVRRERIGRAREGGGGGRRVELLLELEPFLPGDLRTPEVRVTPVLRGGERGEPLVLGTMPVEVVSVIAGDAAGAAMADVKGPVEPPPGGRGWLIAGMVGACCAALGAIAGGLWLARRSSESPAPARPAHEVALDALARLRERGLHERGHMKPFYVELSGILRRYIEARLGLHAPEQTTEEFLRDARGCIELTTRDVELLERFLAHCDMVKFAALEVGREQAESSLRTVEDFIERTRAVDAGASEAGSSPARARREAAA